MHAGCQQEVTRPEHATALILRDLAYLWQRKSFDRQKYKFRFNSLRNRHIRRYYVGPVPFRNALPVTGKIRALCKPFPTIRSAHFARFCPAGLNLAHRSQAQISRFTSRRFTSHRCACGEMPARPDRPARSCPACWSARRRACWRAKPPRRLHAR